MPILLPQGAPEYTGTRQAPYILGPKFCGKKRVVRNFRATPVLNFAFFSNQILMTPGAHRATRSVTIVESPAAEKGEDVKKSKWNLG